MTAGIESRSLSFFRAQNVSALKQTGSVHQNAVNYVGSFSPEPLNTSFTNQF